MPTSHAIIAGQVCNNSISDTVVAMLCSPNVDSPRWKTLWKPEVTTMETQNIIKGLIEANTVADNAKIQIAGTETALGLLDHLLENIKGAENIHAFWNDVYNDNGWSYKVYDADENRMISVEGAKAPAKIKTYKSQSIKAFKAVGGNRLNRWSDVKAAIENPKTDFKVRQENVFKALKDLLKSAEAKGDGVLLEKLESLANA